MRRSSTLAFLLLACAFAIGCARQAGFVAPPDTIFDPNGAWDPAPGKWERHYIDRCAAFRAENETLDPDARYIVFVGDSLTEGFDLDRWFPGERTLNRGIVSDGIAQWPAHARPRGLTNRLHASILDCRPQVVFLLLGTNDLPHENVSMEYWIGNYGDIVDTTLAAFPGVTFVMHTLPPTGSNYSRHAFLNPRIEEFNGMLRDLAERKGLPLIDVHGLYADERGMLPDDLTRDGLHISQDGYARWADAARAYFPRDPALPANTG